MPDNVSEAFSCSTPAAVCRHFSQLLQCHVCFLFRDHSVRCTFISGHPSSHPDDGSLFGALFGGQTISGRPHIRLTRPGETYISVDLFKNGDFDGRLVAGPITDSLTHPAGRKAQTVNCDNFDFVVSTAALLYYFVYEKWVDTDELYKEAMSTRLPVQKKELEGMPRSETPAHASHHSVAYENQLYSLITQGNSKSLARAVNAPPDGVYGLLDKRHPLRNLKNDCICILTLATRAAIAGGLDSETAFSLSDEAIQRVELYDNVNELFQVVEQILFRLTNLVESIHSLNHSHRVNYCRNYVLHHIYEKLIISEIAKHAGVSPEYLAEQFKRETGICLKTFIEQTRVEEARRLLLSTDKTILEITLMLNYHDQSHFIRSFKREVGVTPAVFRRNNQ